VFEDLVLEVDELLRAEAERFLTVGSASGADDVGAGLTISASCGKPGVFPPNSSLARRSVQGDFGFQAAALPVAPTVSLSQSGWTVGVGGEYAFLNWLTGFVEYDYYRFNNNNSTALACTAVVCGITTTGVDVSTNINARALQMGA
jgi:opacity protein-like surface antigen